MVKKQILFSDYDGTLYIKNQDMQRNIKLIDKYRELGGKFVIVTGRSKNSIDGEIKKYNIPYDYIITNNGASIFDDTGNKIYNQPISIKTSLKIIDYLKSKENIEVFYYAEQDKVEYNKQELLKIRVRTSERDVAKNIEKQLNIVFANKIVAHAAFPSIYYSNSEISIVEIVSAKAGKEKSIRKLLQLLNIPSEQVITIGDGRNDIAMIKEFNGYSMETADEEVKQVASKIFKSVGDMIEQQ